MKEETKCEICNKTFKNEEGLAMHNSAKHSKDNSKKEHSLNFKKIKGWGIFLVIVALFIWGIIALLNSSGNVTKVDESDLDFEVPKGAIHWHPNLKIIIDGDEQRIPANVGLTGGHSPIHTHTDANTGVIHVENNQPSKKTVTLGYFFEVWGKNFNSTCIFDNCEGELKMLVNGKENLDFQNYFMQEGDKIRIEYNSQ